MRWKYITEAYRQALDIPIVPIHLPRYSGVSYIGPNECLPPPGQSTLHEGILFEGFVYLREHGAWTRLRKAEQS